MNTLYYIVSSHGGYAAFFCETNEFICYGDTYAECLYNAEEYVNAI